ncbi:hypothetical protein SteCoe_38700 [Stentor coeruleus]|uniref:Uncharacterized protein n=1 Tax=Stentor coeruleus TaxID=5963 RepID=A0A1R2AL43_9CILI|nr:hypothetical protein SteCoe_38700 [Stentor coeruleus]
MLKELKYIVNCDKDFVRDLTETKQILIGLGIGVLVICGGVLLPFIFYTQKKMNLLWNQIKKSAIEDSKIFMELCVDRLETLHKAYNFSITQTTQKQKDRIVYFSYKYNYLWRLVLLALLGSCYYLISNYCFYDNIEFLLNKKPELYYNIIFARARTTSLNFFARNYAVEQMLIDPQHMSPNFVSISTDYNEKLQYNTEELLKNLNEFVKPGFKELRSNKIVKSLFSQVQDSSGIMRAGIYAGVFNTIFESFYIGFSVDYHKSIDSQFFQVIELYYKNIVELGHGMEHIFEDAQNWSITIITRYLNSYIIFAIVFSVALLIIYAVLYYPFLHTQEKKVQALDFFAGIFLNSVEDKIKA